MMGSVDGVSSKRMINCDGAVILVIDQVVGDGG